MTVDPSEARPRWTMTRIRGYLPSFVLAAVGLTLIVYTLFSYAGDLRCMAVGIGLGALSLLASVLFWGLSGIMEGAAMSAEMMVFQVFWDPYERVVVAVRDILEREAVNVDEFTPVEYARTGRNEFVRRCFQQRVEIGIDSAEKDDSYIFELNGGKQIVHVVVFELERLRTTYVNLYPKEDENKAVFARILDGLKVELDAVEGFESMPDWYRARLEAEAD